MAFGSIDKSKTPFKRSVTELQESFPIFDGEGKNTFRKDGKYFFMNREVSKDEYEKGIARYEAILDHQIKEKETELRQAA